jgi:septal ring factor EnvC (AmiA/AmiB activator)
VLSLVLSTSLVLYAQTTDRARTEAQARRASERLQALQREAEELAARERSLLIDLRRLEVERDLKTETLKQIDADLTVMAAQLGDTTTRIQRLEAQERAQRPALEARLAEIYKLGDGGYVRMLFSVDDPTEIARSYRMVAAVSALDRQRALEHRRSLDALRKERLALEQRGSDMTRLQQDARAARADADRAALSRSRLIAQIDARRDLMAELAGELQAAQQRLQQTLGAISSGAPRAASDAAALPIKPFQGDLDWPASGRLMSRFGRQGNSVSSAAAQNGIQIGTQEGSVVRAVHDGTVAYAAPFTGYGNLVIVDHGTQTYSMYGQLGSMTVARGGRIDRGQAVGTAGRVLAGTPGLYFEMRVDGEPVDPLEWLRK